MTSIFLSYRRRDSKVVTRSIYRELANHYGEDFVFFDERSIAEAENIRGKIRDVLSQCSVFMPIIASEWLESIIASGLSGGSWHEPSDWVWLEIEEAMSYEGVHILPVLVDGVEMPHWSILPSKLKQLHFKKAFPIRSDSIGAGVQWLIRQRLDHLINGSSLTIAPNFSSQDDYEALRREHYRHETQYCLEINNGVIDDTGTIYLNALRQHLKLSSRVIAHIHQAGEQTYRRYEDIIGQMIECQANNQETISPESFLTLEDLVGRKAMLYLRRLHLNFKIPRWNALKIEQRVLNKWKVTVANQS